MLLPVCCLRLGYGVVLASIPIILGVWSGLVCKYSWICACMSWYLFSFGLVECTSSAWMLMKMWSRTSIASQSLP